MLVAMNIEAVHLHQQDGPISFQNFAHALEDQPFRTLGVDLQE